MSGVPVQFGDSTFEVNGGESLLESAERAGVDIPSSCRSGSCQSCLVKVTAGGVPPEAQRGLTPNQRACRLALACQLRPTLPIEVTAPDNTVRYTLTVLDHHHLTPEVLRLRLSADRFNWFPGQFISVHKDEQTARPYSVASLTEDGYLELHIKRHNLGAVSNWLHDNVKVGDKISVSEARGNCFYHDTMTDKPLLLVGVGTGLAPLYGIAREALRRGHQNKMFLHIGARDRSRLYLEHELSLLNQSHSQLEYSPVFRQSDHAQPSDITQHIVDTYTKLQNWCIFLCGAPDMVKKLEKFCFLNGASLSNIYSDPFISS